MKEPCVSPFADANYDADIYPAIQRATKASLIDASSLGHFRLRARAVTQVIGLNLLGFIRTHSNVVMNDRDWKGLPGKGCQNCSQEELVVAQRA